MDQITDAELVAKVRLGDKEAFGQLVERYQLMVEHIAKKMIVDEWVARELTQEAILQAYLSLDHLRDASRFKSWLYGITLNICRSYLHDQKMDLLSLETIMGGVRSDISTNFDDTIDPQTIAEAHDLHRLVLDAIDDLSARDKEAMHAKNLPRFPKCGNGSVLLSQESNIVTLSDQYCHSERQRRISRDGKVDSSLALRMTIYTLRMTIYTLRMTSKGSQDVYSLPNAGLKDG